MKRTLKRVDLTSRTFFALIEPGSAFAGSLFELALAADRSYMFHDDNEENVIALSPMNFGPLTMSNGITRLQTRFLDDPAKIAELRGARRAAQRGRRGGGRPRHLRARRDRLGRRGAGRDRGARRVLARRDDRPRGQPPLRRARDDGDEDLRTADRVAELDLPAAERGRRQRRAAISTASRGARNSTGSARKTRASSTKDTKVDTGHRGAERHGRSRRSLDVLC